MSWGSEWGSLWGDLGGDAATFADRLLMFVRGGPNFQALVGTFATRTVNLTNICERIRESFDVETGYGEQLDRLGAILQRPRNGASDTRYRVLLQIQIELILSSTGTTPRILRIVDLFSGTAAGPVHYADQPPMGFEVSAVLDDDDASDLVALLGEASGAAYGVTLVALDEGYLVADYTPASPVAGAGTSSYTPADEITGAGLVGYEYTP